MHIEKPLFVFDCRMCFRERDNSKLNNYHFCIVTDNLQNESHLTVNCNNTLNLLSGLALQRRLVDSWMCVHLFNSGISSYKLGVADVVDDSFVYMVQFISFS